MKKELAALGSNHTASLTLNASLSARRLSDRAGLLDRLDGIKRDLDSGGMMDAMDRF
jgi:hypothetical protein